MTDEETIIRLLKAQESIADAQSIQNEAFRRYVDAALHHHTARILAIVESVNTPERRAIANAIRSMK